MPGDFSSADFGSDFSSSAGGLVTQSITVGSPTIDFAEIGIARILPIRLTPIGLVVDNPFFGVPVGPVRDLASTGVTVGSPTIDVPLFQIGDPINPGILLDAGSQLIYRQATGLEKALADVDAYNLTRTYAELVRDQWDPYAINYRNLSYLAWAVGVNLWEEDWDETFRRYWVANQWTYKSQRGCLLGISNFLAAAGSNTRTCPYGIKVISAITPPAKFFPGKTTTTAERATYLARFPQLRIYPYVARALLPYDCYCGNFPLIKTFPPTKKHNFNGSFIGPLRKFYPTAADAGGRYTRTAYYWDRGISTKLTFRTIIDINSLYGATIYDQITIPAHKDDHWYLGQKNKWPLPNRHPLNQNDFSIFLGNSNATKTMQILIPRNGQLNLATAQAQYQTINTGMQMIDVTPNHISTPHSYGPYSLFCGAINKSSEYTNEFSEALTFTTTSLNGKIRYSDSYPQIIFDGVWETGDVINFTVVGSSGSYTVKNLQPTSISVAAGMTQAINALGVTSFSTTTSSGTKVLLLPKTPVVNKQYLFKKFLPPSKAWMFMYEQWFFFDPSRVPDYRKASVYMGHARLGIQRYTAEIKIAAFGKSKLWYFRVNGAFGGHLRPADLSMINKVRRAVTASMALRDTVRIDTVVKRLLNTNDSVPIDGSFRVGEMVDA